MTPWGTLRVWIPEETFEMVEDERAVLCFVHERQVVGVWELLRGLCRARNLTSWSDQYPFTQRILALITRLCRQKKLRRYQKVKLVVGPEAPAYYLKPIADAPDFRSGQSASADLEATG